MCLELPTRGDAGKTTTTPPTTIRQDKDGVSAAAAFAEMAAAHARAGTTVRARLEALQQRYGARAFRGGYFIADPPAKAAAVFEELRAGGYPESVAGERVVGARAAAEACDCCAPFVAARVVALLVL